MCGPVCGEKCEQIDESGGSGGFAGTSEWINEGGRGEWWSLSLPLAGAVAAADEGGQEV